MMTRRRLFLSAAIITVVILLTFALSVPHTRDSREDTLSLSAPPGTPTVALRDTFKKGVHTLSGRVEAPDACRSVSAEAVLGTDAQNILLTLSLSERQGVCLELSTAIRFETSVEAPDGLPITVMVNGAPASTTPL